MERKAIDRLPYVETTIGFGIGEKLLNQTFSPVSIPQLGLKLRKVEDEKALSRLLHRDNIAVRLLAPTFSEGPEGKGGQPLEEHRG